jgi:hypothetical protein
MAQARRVSADQFDFDAAPRFRKTATIPVANVVFARGGEEIVTLQPDDAGKFIESKNIAKPGDAIVTRSPGDSYIPKKFSNNFEIDPNNPAEYRSKNFGRAIFQTEPVVIAAPWGEDQTIMAGGVIFESHAGAEPEVYGNQAASFEADYAREAADGGLMPLTAPFKRQLEWAIGNGETAHVADIGGRLKFAIERAESASGPNRKAPLDELRALLRTAEAACR